MTEEEIKIQMALGTAPPEMKINPCRYTKIDISKGKRKCYICGEYCINKNDEFYHICISNWNYGNYINICMDCSWLPITTIKRIIKETKAKLNESKSK